MKRTLARFTVVLALIVSASDSGAQATDADEITVRIPPQIGDFAMSARRDFEDKSVMLRYMRADSLYGDVFLYSGPDFTPSCDSSCAQGVLKAEGDDFINAFPEFVRRKYADTITVTSDQQLTPPANAPWRIGRHVRMWQMKDGKTQWSDLYLFYLRGFRVKVRATYPADSATAVVIRELAAAAPFAMTGGTDAAAGPASAAEKDEVVAVSVTLPGSPDATLPKLLALLGRFGYTVEDSSFRAGRLVTAPRYTWPAGSEKEAWHGKESPGMRLVINFAPKGDSTDVKIRGQSPTRPEWTDAKVAQMLQMISVMEYAAGLSPDKAGRKRKTKR